VFLSMLSFFLESGKFGSRWNRKFGVLIVGFHQNKETYSFRMNMRSLIGSLHDRLGRRLGRHFGIVTMNSTGRQIRRSHCYKEFLETKEKLIEFEDEDKNGNNIQGSRSREEKRGRKGSVLGEKQSVWFDGCEKDGVSKRKSSM